MLGRFADTAVTWLIDLMLGVPHIVLLILISYALGKGFWGVTLGVALTHWPGLCRVLRAEMLQMKESVYLSIARQLGEKSVVYCQDAYFSPDTTAAFRWIARDVSACDLT